MIKILAVGNSFSQDATAYLHDIAKHGGIDTKIVNLYIGGCSLDMHWEFASNDVPNYEYELNGSNTGKKVSVKEALLEDKWDYITIQQASHDSGIIDTYFPYITLLSEYIKKYSPDATQLIHQTWAYETDSTHNAFIRYDNNQAVMYNALKTAYQKVSEKLGLPMIPCGDVIQTLRGLSRFDYAGGGKSLCRDGFHMHMIYGRYALAATWYETILRGNILDNDFMPPGVNTADLELIRLIQKTVHI